MSLAQCYSAIHRWNLGMDSFDLEVVAASRVMSHRPMVHERWEMRCCWSKHGPHARNTPQDRFAMKSLAEEEGVPQSVFAAFKEVSHRWIPTSLETLFDHLPGKAEKGGNNTWPVLQGTPCNYGQHCCLSQLWQCIVSAFCHACIWAARRGADGGWTVALEKAILAIFSPCTLREDNFLLCRDGGSGKMYTNQPEEQFLQDGKELFVRWIVVTHPYFKQIAFCFSKGSASDMSYRRRIGKARFFHFSSNCFSVRRCHQRIIGVLCHDNANTTHPTVRWGRLRA